MNKIGFQNFRRFLNFPELEYGGITLLVGKNNSGKSTMVKALLLITDFLKSSDMSTFSFGNNVLEDTNIVTFKRALNYEASLRNDDSISFTFQTDEFVVEIKISGEGDQTSADVHKVSIYDTIESIEYLIEPKLSNISIIKKHIESGQKTNSTSELVFEIEKVKSQLENSVLKKSSKEYIELIDIHSTLSNKLLSTSSLQSIVDNEIEDNTVESLLDPELSNEYNVSTYSKVEGSLDEIFEDAFFSLQTLCDIENQKFNSEDDVSDNFNNLKNFYIDRNKIDKSINKFIKSLNNLSIIYLGANPTKQSALFAIREKNNSLAQAIHEYYQFGIDKTKANPAYVFVKKWMGEEQFDIGDDFEIKLHAGEAYEVTIKKKNTIVQLADKGMGSIQAMLLILRIACIIYKKEKQDKNPITLDHQIITFNSGSIVFEDRKKINIVIIEEPELNLHPALQSRLAELFFEINEKFGIQLIVETHSEYIIRKAQVIVAEKDLEVAPNTNPFSVFYFSEKEIPYKIGFNSDGTLTRNFEKGFYDEASLRALELMKINRLKNA